MTVVVLGASGATGKLVVELLRAEGHDIVAIIRPTSAIPLSWCDDDKITIHRKAVDELEINEVISIVRNCNAIVSCLGHNMSFKGIFGKPRTFVSEAVKLFCEAVKENAPRKPVKFVLMNTIGYLNKDEKEKVPVIQSVIMSLLRILTPPHRDNELAAEFLRVKLGQKTPNLEWCVVRPDALINDDKVTQYAMFRSPINNLFTAQKVSRINVAHFMTCLITQDGIWDQWKGKMPVIYNKIV